VVESVYSAVRVDSLYKVDYIQSLKVKTETRMGFSKEVTKVQVP